jgi:hypothetical protein
MPKKDLPENAKEVPDQKLRAITALESIIDSLSNTQSEDGTVWEYDLSELNPDKDGIAEFQLVKRNAMTGELFGASEREVRFAIEQTVPELIRRHGEDYKYWEEIIKTKGEQSGGVLITVGERRGLMSRDTQNRYDVTDDFSEERRREVLESIRWDAYGEVSELAMARRFRVSMLETDSRFFVRFILKNPDGSVANEAAHQQIWNELINQNQKFTIENTELLTDDVEGSSIMLKIEAPLR